MLLYFDQNGVLKEMLTYGNPARVGTTNFKIIAYFEGLDLAVHNTASIKLIRPGLNTTQFPSLLMTRKIDGFTYDSSIGGSSDYFVNQETYSVFEFDFANFTSAENLVILLDTPGLWSAIISVYSSLLSERLVTVQGAATFNAQSGTFYDDEDPAEVSSELLNDMINLRLAQKLDIENGFVVLNEEPESLSGYDEGQIVFLKSDHKFYQVQDGSLVLYDVGTGGGSVDLDPVIVPISSPYPSWPQTYTLTPVQQERLRDNKLVPLILAYEEHNVEYVFRQIYFDFGTLGFICELRNKILLAKFDYNATFGNANLIVSSLFDVNNLVTTNTDQTIAANKTFNNLVEFNGNVNANSDLSILYSTFNLKSSINREYAENNFFKKYTSVLTSNTLAELYTLLGSSGEPCLIKVSASTAPSAYSSWWIGWIRPSREGYKQVRFESCSGRNIYYGNEVDETTTLGIFLSYSSSYRSVLATEDYNKVIISGSATSGNINTVDYYKLSDNPNSYIVYDGCTYYRIEDNSTYLRFLFKDYLRVEDGEVFCHEKLILVRKFTTSFPTTYEVLDEQVTLYNIDRVDEITTTQSLQARTFTYGTGTKLSDFMTFYQNLISSGVPEPVLVYFNRDGTVGNGLGGPYLCSILSTPPTSCVFNFISVSYASGKQHCFSGSAPTSTYISNINSSASFYHEYLYSDEVKTINGNSLIGTGDIIIPLGTNALYRHKFSMAFHAQNTSIIISQDVVIFTRQTQQYADIQAIYADQDNIVAIKINGRPGFADHETGTSTYTLKYVDTYVWENETASMSGYTIDTY